MSPEIEKAKDFLKEIEAEKNEHGVYIYTSTNGASSINLPFILADYERWLEGNN
jgi:hypothetical protein